MRKLDCVKKSKFWSLLWVYLVLLLVLEMFVVRQSYFGSNGLDASFGFFAAFGFLASVFCVVVAIVLGMICHVRETYYD